MSVTEFLSSAAAEPVQLKVRDLLGVWGFRARTFENVDRIARDLSAAGLICEPGLSEGGLDSLVRVGLGDREDVSDETGEEDEPLQLPTVAPRIRDIPSATAGVTSVLPDQTLGFARGLMIEHEYSQLPVMASELDLIGYVSWRSIAEAQLRKSVITLTDATKGHPHVVGADDMLLSHVHDIDEADFVFVRERDDRICGIVTSADLSYQFTDLTTPFFQVGEIENRLRIVIDNAFSPEELRQVTGNPRVKTAADLMFGQYIRLLNDETRWQRMHWDGIDRARFIQCLDDTRKIRNKIMHFGEELTSDMKQRLTQCLRYMRTMLPVP